MSKYWYKRGQGRQQKSLIPTSLDDLIDVDNPVRAIDKIVDAMDVHSLGFKYSEKARTGRNAYNPSDMLKLYIYCYFNGIRSSRKIERECTRNMELKWLLEELCPDHKTIANFRRDNKEAIAKSFSKFIMLCNTLGLLGKELVAVDGSKFRANNSTNNYITGNKIETQIKYFRKQIDKYIELLDDNDDDEDKNPPPKFNREDVAKKLENIKERIKELEDLEKQIIITGSIALTDSDSKMMKVKNNGFEVSYNVQIAVDDKYKLVVATDVTSEAIDTAELYNISHKAKDELGVEELTVVGDKGYYSSLQFKCCEEENIYPIVPKPILKATPDENYAKDRFAYDSKKDEYICPQGNKLVGSKHRERKKYSSESYTNKTACKECVALSKCTKTRYRIITDGENQKYSHIVDARTKANEDIVRERKCLVEHHFGTVKRALGFTYFLTRKIENVRTETILHFLVYNFKRMINIIGTKAILQGI